MTIKIKTRLDDGIYAESGGGRVVTHYEYNTGPRNLLAAIRRLDTHRNHMVLNYGGIGCGDSWIEVAGVRISRSDIEYVKDECEFYTSTRTSRAKELLC